MMTTESRAGTGRVPPARAAQKAPAAPPRARRGARRPAPEGAAELAHLPLAALRAYRAELTSEEGRVSYWRRLVQARIDLVRSAPAPGADEPGRRRLAALLADAPSGSRRSSLLAVLPCDDVPPVPDLARLWVNPTAPEDGPARRRVLAELHSAERALSTYRAALHRRLDRATAELIARYHADPAVCLVALPLRPEDRAG